MPGPHDLFARYTFEHPRRAEAELRAVLPPAVVAEVDWSTLRRESGSVVDRELRETESDLLFSARLRGGRSVLLYVLLEHQSSVDAWMAWRMLRYVVRQLEHWRQRHPESSRLPVIIPLVLYHGAEGGWTAPRRVEELFDVPEPHESWRALVPRFEYLLDDLTTEQAESLMARAGPPVVRLALLALRYGRSEELAEQLPRWTALFAETWAEPGGQQELFTLIRYLLRVGDETTHAATAGVLHSVMDARRAEALMRSFGDELIERGRQQGLAQGLEKGNAQGEARGRAEGVLRILTVRGVPVDEAARQRILSCSDLATLSLWFDRAINATRLADVLDDAAH